MWFYSYAHALKRLIFATFMFSWPLATNSKRKIILLSSSLQEPKKYHLSTHTHTHTLFVLFKSYLMHQPSEKFKKRITKQTNKQKVKRRMEKKKEGDKWQARGAPIEKKHTICLYIYLRSKVFRKKNISKEKKVYLYIDNIRGPIVNSKVRRTFARTTMHFIYRFFSHRRHSFILEWSINKNKREKKVFCD